MSIVSALQTGVSALNSFTKGIQVIGDNIANVSTVGYKKSRADYADNFSDLLNMPASAGVAGANAFPQQLGSGVNVASVSTNFNTEKAEFTGQEGNLAINGQGFFRVADPNDAGRTYFTRAGDFSLDDSGYLVTPQGYRLQGDNTLDTAGFQVPATATNPTTGNTDTVTGWSFAPSTGEMSLVFSDGSKLAAGTVSLSQFTEPQGLLRQGGNLYAQSDAAGTRTDFNPGDSQAASVHSQYLEMSNVDLTQEFASMITTQRGFQAGARIITTSDQLMQEAIQLKR